jgi:hypothetical protein
MFNDTGANAMINVSRNHYSHGPMVKVTYRSKVMKQWHHPDGHACFKENMIGVWIENQVMYAVSEKVARDMVDFWRSDVWEFEISSVENVHAEELKYGQSYWSYDRCLHVVEVPAGQHSVFH